MIPSWGRNTPQKQASSERTGKRQRACPSKRRRFDAQRPWTGATQLDLGRSVDPGWALWNGTLF